MTFSFRRVVTAHDDEGRAVVASDEIVDSEPRLPGYDAKVVWCTSQFPPSNDGDAVDGTPGPPGTRVLFRTAEFSPKVFDTPSMHRTETQDIALILSGRLDMVLDSGDVVESLGPGDFVIQRGTMHEWVPRGTEPIRLLFVLMDSPPVRVGDLVLGDDLSALGGAVSPMPRADDATG